MATAIGRNSNFTGSVFHHECSEPQNYITHVITQCISSHVLSGLCKIGGYEILRHGTSWANYKSILKIGVDLSRGGRTTEDSTCNFVTTSSTILLPDGRSETTTTTIPRAQTLFARNQLAINSENKFYVFRDSKFGITEDGDAVLPRFLVPLLKRIGPTRHSCLAYLAQYKKEVNDGEETGWMTAASLVKAVFTPKLKFIYSLQEIEGSSEREGVFVSDPDYSTESAYLTSLALPNHRIGLMGFLTHANKDHIWEHIKNNPGKCVEGVAQLAAGILLTLTPGLGFIT